jgi:hypothetical protein
MDIRDILKSFDNLSEGESTVHRAGPGGYGNKHGSEDVTDQYGKPIGRMSLGKLGAQNEPKRGKGRPPNPDKAQSYDSSALSKAMGMGKAPKPTGKPSVKHSLKEYFNELDDALNEAGLAVQPMPVTPQQKQQQAVASKPSFMIKDPANPTTPAITTSDPAVVSAAKNGTMTMQKPGAAPTQQVPGATPATGAGSQIAPMEEDGENWIKGAIKHPGAFTAKAKSHGMTPAQFRAKVLAHKEDYPAKTEKQAQLAKTLGKMHESHGMMEADSGALDWKSMITPNASVGELRDMFEKYDLPRSIADFLEYAKDARNLGQAMQYFDKKSLEDEDYGSRVDREYGGNVSSGYYQLQDLMSEQMDEAEAPQHFAQSSPLSTANRGVLEGTRIPTLNQLLKTSSPLPKDTYYIVQGSIDDDEGRELTVYNIYYNNKSVFGPYRDPKSATRKLKQLEMSEQMDEADAPQHFAQSSPLSTANRGVLESKKGVNPFAKKDDKDEKKGAAPKKGVNPFAKKEVKKAAKPDFLDLDKDGNKKEPMKTAAKDKKKVKEGMEHNLQAARLEGKSHALRKMPYNCTHDDMEEARHYHDGFKEGLDECYGQIPIMGRTAVDEVSPTLGLMASYGADDMGMDEGNAFTAGLAKTPQGGKFKVGGSTFTDRTSYDSPLDEFAFESFDKQLNALLESEEKVSEGMTVSISKGQHGSPDSVSVSAQDGEADQLLSIIKSAGLGLFGGEEKGFNAPEGGAGAHGGISVVDDHDGMMALMKRLSGGEMSAGHDHEGEEGHSHEGEEEPCNECGYMESQCQCGGDKEVVDEVESEDQMAYKVAEDNPPDNGSANSTNATMGNAAANASLAKADAGEEEEPVAEADEEDDKEDFFHNPRVPADKQLKAPPKEVNVADSGEKDDEKDFFHNPNVPADKQLKAPPKEVNVAESFANLYKKLAFLSEESTEKEDEKAEKAGKKVAKDIEYDEGHKGKDDDKAERAGKKVTKDIEYDDKKDKKVDESYANSADDTFEADIDFMTKVISGGLNGQKSTGQTTLPVISGQGKRTGIDGKKDIKESILNESVNDWKRLAGISK